MKIRTKRIQNSILTAKQEFFRIVLYQQIDKLEQKTEFKGKIGGELVITQKSESNPHNVKLYLSAFDQRILSQFIAELMIICAEKKLPMIFSAKTTEAFNEPVHQSEIIF